DAEEFREPTAEEEAVRRGIRFRQQQAQDALPSERAHTKRGRHAAVDAPGEAEHGSLALQPAEHALPDAPRDPPDLGRGVENERLSRERVMGDHGPAPSGRVSSRLLIFPLGVFGSDARNSTNLGIAKSSRRRAQWRRSSCSVSRAPSRRATTALMA